MTSERKIVDLDTLSGIIEEEKGKGKKIALANGCFDIVHVGHVRYLKEAAEQGDLLVVALNDDDSVRRLKGPPRPIIPLEGRMRIVAAYGCVDYVVPFPEATVEAVLRRLKPDFHCKGTDYTEETVPEKEVVRSYGGRVVVVGDPKDHSSRNIIKEIGERFGGVGRGNDEF